MAKPFYSLQEVCERLGKSEDQVKALVRDGELREFRDAGKIFFKAEDVEHLAGPADPGDSGTLSLADSGEILLESAEDEPAPSGGGESGGTSIIGLEAMEEEQSAPPAPGHRAPPPPPVEEPEGASIGIFDEELDIDADPMAKTQITSTPIGDQVSLEGTGSGSGLLDLTREADDTSLGAELLDEIYPSDEAAAAAPATDESAHEEEADEAEAEEPEPTAEIPAAAGMSYEASQPVVYGPVQDPLEGVFGGLLVGALLLLVFAASVAAAALQGFIPSYAASLTGNFWIMLGILAGVPVVTVLLGWVVGRFAVPRRN